MRHLKSLDSFETKRGLVFSLESPIEAPREFASYRDALGEFTIDGAPYTAVGFEWNVPLAPVRVGEKIGILVKPR
jgi:hypothetical protein